MRKRLILILLLSVLSGLLINVTAQTAGKYSISGTISESGSNEPLFMADVVVKELGLWATTDDKGYFEFPNVPAGKITLVVSSMGYETRDIILDVKGNLKKLSIKMNVTSLSLDEVVVTAKESSGINTASSISKQTIEHIQPSSLKDVMQLLPGNVTENPSLTSINSLTIRDVGINSVNVLGTALIVDGASLSNDANLQSYSTGSIVNSTSGNSSSTAGGGVDARQVSTDNIESVQVIRGIPSVEYGDMTSGAIVVKTKAGVTPFEIRIKADPQLKQVSAGKGFSLGEKAGIMNIDADYAKAYSDVRTPASAYDRVNLQIAYSNNFAKKLTFNVKLRGNFSNASTRSDSDLFIDEIEQQKEQGVRLNINGRWIIRKPWITNIEYLVSGGVSSQYSRSRVYQGSAGYTPTTNSVDEGEKVGFFTPAQYYSDVTVSGLPVDGQARLTANLFGQYGIVNNKVLLGIEWMGQGNFGKGKEFNPLNPPSPGSGAAYRERSYYDIPFLHRMTAFLEDNIKIPVGSTSFELQAGARLNILSAKKINTSGFFTVEPRVNLKYNIIEKKNRALGIRGGWGIAYKMPSMAYLYPEDAYKDMVSFSYNDFDANNYGLTVITTKKMETINTSLRAQKSVNIEAGIDFDAGFVNGSLVYYNEKLTDGYGFVQTYVPMTYNRFGYKWVNGQPSQETIASGMRPTYQDGKVLVNGNPISFITDTTFMSYYRPVNGITNNKWGVEFTFNFAKIKAINTTINVSGAYMNMETLNTQMTQRLYAGTSNGRSYPYVGIYGGSSTTSTGSVKERFSTNVRFITHIPKIAMVITLTAQMVFMDRTQTLSQYNNESLPYYYDETGVRVSGADALADKTHTKFVNPIYIMNRAGTIIPFTQAMEQNPTYKNLILTTNTGSYYIRSGYPFYCLFNLRVTKEIKKIATISFYANNFLNLKGRVKNSVTGYEQNKNTPIYFGAEIKIAIK